MVPDDFPRGRFSYGRNGVIELEVEYVDGPSRVIPMRDLWGMVQGPIDRAQIDLRSAGTLAARAGVTPREAAHFQIAFTAATIVVGRAIPRLGIERMVAPKLWATMGDPVTQDEFNALLLFRDLLALETTASMAQWHRDPVDGDRLRQVRHWMVTTFGKKLDSEYQPGVQAAITGDIGARIADALANDLLPWLKRHFAR